MCIIIADAGEDNISAARHDVKSTMMTAMKLLPLALSASSAARVCVYVCAMMIVLLLHDALLIPSATSDLYKHTDAAAAAVINRRSGNFRPSATNAFATSR